MEKIKVGQGEEKARVGLLSQLVIQPVAGVILDLHFHTVKEPENSSSSSSSSHCADVTQHLGVAEIMSYAQCGKIQPGK